MESETESAALAHLRRIHAGEQVIPEQPLAASRSHRWLAPASILLLFCFPVLHPTLIRVLSDAYWQVGAFVGITLWLFYALHAHLSGSSRLSALLASSQRYQVLFAAFMGVLPGCGGAIIVMTQFVKGQVSFGALVAVLTATMGDAAILLMVSSPRSAAIVLSISFVVGVVTGYCVDRVHADGFMRPGMPVSAPTPRSPVEQPRIGLGGYLWKRLLFPSTAVALLIAFQCDVDALFRLPAGTVSVVGTLAAMLVLMAWALSPAHAPRSSCDGPGSERVLIQRVADDTTFVLCWVIAGFLSFELLLMLTAVDLSVLLSGAPSLVILGAILIGLVPGCGPQILTTTLYLSGSIPLSAQLGNAISNDGDALFPALALAPRAAAVATLYSAVPALIVAYSYAYLFE